METTTRTTWEIWECLKPESLERLISVYKHLNLKPDPFREIEPLEELAEIMKIPTHWKKPPK